MGDVRYGDANTLLEKELGVRRTLLTTSCTHALELAALLLEIQPYCVIYGNGGGNWATACSSDRIR